MAATSPFSSSPITFPSQFRSRPQHLSVWSLYLSQSLHLTKLSSSISCSKSVKSLQVKASSNGSEPSAASPSSGDSLAPPRSRNSSVKRHTVSVFVRDESCMMINRIAGLFASRGYNFESFAVGLNEDKALFTVVVPGTERALQQVVEQLSKLVYVMKLNVDPDKREEVMGLVDIFRAQIVDVSENGSLTIEVTGDPGKMVAARRSFAKFEIKEIAGAGKIALRREKMEASTELPFWRFSPESPLLKHTEVEQPSSSSSSGGDVYPAEPYENFSMNQILDANWGRLYDEDSTGLCSHTLSILVNDTTGFLSAFTGVIWRRGYNIQSLAVSSAEMQGLSRITTVVPGTEESISKLVQYLYKLIDVHDVKDLNYMPFAERELMLIKVAVNTSTARGDILDIADIFRAKVADLSHRTITLQLSGHSDKMVALQRLLEPYGICELARTGRVALTRESGVDSKYLRGGYSLMTVTY